MGGVFETVYRFLRRIVFLAVLRFAVFLVDFLATLRVDFFAVFRLVVFFADFLVARFAVFFVALRRIVFLAAFLLVVLRTDFFAAFFFAGIQIWCKRLVYKESTATFSLSKNRYTRENVSLYIYYRA